MDDSNTHKSKFPALSSAHGPITDGWFSSKQSRYNQHVLDAFLSSKHGYLKPDAISMPMQDDADRLIHSLSKEDKTHLPKPPIGEFILTKSMKAVRKSRVGGLCGSTLLKEKFDVSVEQESGKLILIDVRNQVANVTSIHAEKLRFYFLKEMIERFKKQKTNKNMRVDEIDDPQSHNIKAELFAKLNTEDSQHHKLPKKMFIYVQDLPDLIRLQNSLLFGMHRKRDRERDNDHKILMIRAIARHKVFLAERFYKLMYQRYRDAEARRKKVNPPISVPPPFVPKIQEPPRVEEPQEKVVREPPRQEEPKPKLPRFAERDFDKADKLLNKAKWKMKTRPPFDQWRNWNKFEKQKKKLDSGMDLDLEKIFVVNRGAEMESSLPEFHVGFTKKKVTPESFAPRQLEVDRTVGVAPVVRGRRGHNGLFNVLEKSRQVFPIREAGYLVVYALDTMENKVTALGIRKIDNSFKRIERMDLHARPGDGKKVHSILNFVRKDTKADGQEDVPEIRALLAPGCFGFMKRFRKVKKESANDENILDVRGEGTRYLSLRELMMMEYRIQDDGSEAERNGFKSETWEKFEHAMEKVYSDNRGNPALVMSEYQFFGALGALPEFRTQSQSAHDREDARRAFLFFSRGQWGSTPEFQRMASLYEASMIVGPPDHLCLPVWCSLGKVSLFKLVARHLVERKSQAHHTFADSAQGPASRACYSYLKSEGLKLIEENESMRLDIERQSGHRMLSPSKTQRLRNIVAAYLQYSKILADCNIKERGFILRRFSLRNVSGIASIALELAELQEKAQGGPTVPQREQVHEEDCLWLMLGLAFVFLPEHYLVPVAGQTDSEEDFLMNKMVADLGLSLKKYQANKVFKTVNSAGNNKLSLVFCYMVQQMHPAIHAKMTNLGFPFLTFTLEAIESLFTGLLNRSKLFRIWNLVFFEGASNKNRRAQQIILSTLMALIKISEKSLLKSQTADELAWNLRAHGMLEFDSDEFLKMVLEIRDHHFVNGSNSGGGLLGQMTKGLGEFFSGVSRLERDIAVIYNDFKGKYSHLAKSNSFFLKVMAAFDDHREHAHLGKVSGRNYKSFFERLKQSYSAGRNVQVARYEGSRDEQILVLSEKPTPKIFEFQILYADFGQKMERGSEVEVSCTFSSVRKLLRPNESRFYEVVQIPIEKLQESDKIEVSMRGYTSGPSSSVYPSTIKVDEVEPGQAVYKHIQAGQVWLVVMVRVIVPEAPKLTVDFPTLQKEFIHLSPPLSKKLAKFMGIKTEKVPMMNVLLNTPIDDPLANQIFAIIYGINQEMPVLEKKMIDNDFYRTGSPNSFEFLSKMILFSPLRQIDKLRCFFLLLNKLDFNNNGSRVKQSHVSFLLWYLTRTSLIYVPYGEVCDRVAALTHGHTATILSAKLVNNGSRGAEDITELLNCWLTSQRRHGLTSVLKLGSGGYLDQLQRALRFWSAASGSAAPSISSSNTLVVVYKSRQIIRQASFEFDSNMRLPPQLREQSEHLLVLEDSDSLLGYSQFCQVMSNYRLLDWVISKDLPDATLTEDYKQSAFSTRVTLKVGFMIDRKRICSASLVSGPGEGLIYTLDSKTYPLVTSMANHSQRYSFGSKILDLGNQRGMRNTHALGSVLEAVCNTAIAEIANSFDKKKKEVVYRQDCLGMVFMDVLRSMVSINGKRLMPEDHSMSIGELCKNLENSTLTVEVVSDSTQRRLLFDHFAVDPDDQTLKSGVHNPLTPCHVVAKSEDKAKVIFQNDKVEKDVEINELVFVP